MTLQKQVFRKQAIGVRGEFYDASPARAKTYLIEENENTAQVGCVFTFASEKSVKCGGDGDFAGICINPKSYANGEVKAGMVAEICSMGRVLVEVKQDVEAGMLGVYEVATGEVAGKKAGEATPSGYADIPNSTFEIFDAKAGSTAVLKLTN